MRDRGLALIGVGEASGEGRAALALEQALTNPLLESTDISQATGVLASFSGGQDMSLFEVEEAAPLLRTAPAHRTTPRATPNPEPNAGPNPEPHRERGPDQVGLRVHHRLVDVLLHDADGPTLLHERTAL